LVFVKKVAMGLIKGELSFLKGLQC
jgi:hypothetical protein